MSAFITSTTKQGTTIDAAGSCLATLTWKLLCVGPTAQRDPTSTGGAGSNQTARWENIPAASSYRVTATDPTAMKVDNQPVPFPDTEPLQG